VSRRTCGTDERCVISSSLTAAVYLDQPRRLTAHRGRERGLPVRVLNGVSVASGLLKLAGDPQIAQTIGKHRDAGLESQWLFAMTEVW